MMAVRKKMPHNFSQKTLVLHNCRKHKARIVQEIVNGLQNPPYSPVLAPCN